MNALSNLPPGVTDYQIEEAAGAFDETERHNSYAWIKPDAEACYLCGKKEFATPVDGFQVRDCDKCGRLVCERCAEVDADDSSIQWQCEQECLVDVRVPVTVTFDFSIFNVKPDEVEAAIERLKDATLKVDLEHAIQREFEQDDEELGSGTRWTPGTADMENVGVRTHARSGGFYPWKQAGRSAKVSRPRKHEFLP